MLSLTAGTRKRHRLHCQLADQIPPRHTRLVPIPLPSGRAAARSTFQQDQECPYNRPVAKPEIAPDGRSNCAVRSGSVGDVTGSWHLILRVFLPFVAVYYLAFIFRNVNATIASSLSSEFGLAAGDLGLLTSVYYLTFAAAQIPIGIVLDRSGPRRVQSVLLIAAALGAALFAVSDSFLLLMGGRALIGLGVAAAMAAGMKALVVWFPRERVPLLSGFMVALGATGALTATLPADFLIGLMGWRGLFGLLAIGSAGCALLIYLVVPEARSVTPDAVEAVTAGLWTVYTDPRFWRLAPLSATCIGTAWALQGLWAAPWLSDVEGLDRLGLLHHLFVMAIALSVGALSLSVMADRLSRRSVGPQVLFGLLAIAFMVAQLALILRWRLPSYIPWALVAAVGAGTVLSYAILAEYFPKQIAGRATAALNVFHIGGAFVLQYMIGVVVQLWTPIDGRYPEVAYQTAFAINVVFQIVAGVWFALPWLWMSLRRRGRLRAVRGNRYLRSSR
jgi:MFS family permease